MFDQKTLLGRTQSPLDNVIRSITLFFATVGFISYLPYKVVPFAKWKGGGLLGSLAGWGLVWLFPWHGPILWAATASLLIFSVGVSHWAELLLGQHDDPRIVIDEVAGVWVACLGIPKQWAPMVLGLILFRVFDVLKGPWGNAAAKAPGGLGVVADDLVAGVIAQALVRLAFRISF